MLKIKMKFVVASERYVDSWKIQDKIQVGDTFITISKKYTDHNMNKFLGNTYTKFTIMESTELDKQTFKIKASSDKRLDFLEKGMLFSVGLTEQIIKLDSKGHIISLRVVNSKSSIIGGEGDIRKYINGTYKLETLKDHVFLATLTKQSNIFFIFFIFLIFLISIFTLRTNLML